MDRHKSSVNIVIAMIAGFLVAGISTSIAYDCIPTDGAAGCVSFDKAVMHLGDLLRNEQGSLGRFLATLAIAALVVFIILSIIDRVQKRRLK